MLRALVLTRWLVFLLLVLLITACDREPRPAAPADSGQLVPVPADDSATADNPRSGWETALGPLLVVASSPREANAVFPTFSDSTLTDTTTFDTSILGGMRVDLFSRTGLAGHGELRPAPARQRD